VDDDANVRLVPRKEIHYCGLVANVDVAVPIAGELCPQPFSAPERAGFPAEKLGAHVVVDPDYI
jgi:hypothetical protein